MRTTPSDALNILTSSQPVATIEIDRGSIPQNESVQSLLCEALATIKNHGVATLHAYYTPSINFLNELTDSVFVMAMGGERVLRHLHASLSGISGLRMRYSDYVPPTRGTPIAHLENGTIWCPLDAISWEAKEVSARDHSEAMKSSVVVEDDEYLGDDDADEEVEEGDETEDSIWDVFEAEPDTTQNEAGRPSRTSTPLRLRAARADASVGSIARTIERMLSLPKGSVLLCGPDRRALRRDASIATLRSRWE